MSQFPEADPPGAPPPTTTRQRREQAIADLAAGQRHGNTPPVAPLATSTPMPSAPSRRSLVKWLLLIPLLLAVLLGALKFTQRASAPTAIAIPDKLTISLAKAGLACPSELAWSPDSLRMAIVARPVTQDRCTSDAQLPPPVIAIFDARTGKELRTLHPDRALGQLMITGVWYGGLIWSSDSARLLLNVGRDYAHPDSAGNPLSAGILELPVNGDAPSAHVRPAPPDASAASDNPIWDLQTGERVTTLAALLSPALSYQWTHTGAITPAQALPTVSAANTGQFSGSPRASAQEFSFWQPGMIVPVPHVDSSGNQLFSSPPVAYFYRAYSTQLSPDGQYAVFSLLLTGRLSTPDGKDMGSLAARYCDLFPYSSCPGALYPLPDKAFSVVMGMVEQGVTFDTGDQTWPAVPVAWQPNGHVLAAVLMTSQQTGQVMFFNTTSGAKVGSIQPNPAVRAIDLAMWWSPEGKQLALLDERGAQLTVYGGSEVPPTA